MKKTLIALLALGGLAAGAAPTVVTLGNLSDDNIKNTYSYVTDSFCVYSGTKDTVKGYFYELSNKDSLLFTPSAGNMAAAVAIEQTWGNSDAITQMNSALGLTSATGFTAENFTAGGFKFTHSSDGGSKNTLTLKLSSAKVGDSITLFVSATSYDTHVKGFSISGLTNTSIAYAGFNGTSGFSSSITADSITYSSDYASNWSPNKKSVMLFKVTGTLASTSLTMAAGDTAKNGWQTLSYVVKPIPEPTTATLSLLALAGLAARRRRK